MSARSTGSDLPDESWAVLQHRLGHVFDDGALLERALVHRSYLNETRETRETRGARGVTGRLPGTLESNERLEFLGDAVIGYVIALELYRRFPDVSEGQLTELRAHLVRWETLAAAGGRLGLGAHMRLGRGEEQSGGRSRPINVARAYEAIVGAVLEDGGLDDAQAFVLRTLSTELEALEATTNVADVKSRLQELTQGLHGATPTYRTVDVSGPDHERVYRVEVLVGERSMGTGEGRNKRNAERAAATEALEQLQRDRA